MKTTLDRPAAGVERMKYILAVVLYGTIGYFLRFVSLPSELVAMCRGLIGGAFILLFQLARGKKPDLRAIRANARWLVISGICLGLNWIFLFAAYMRTTVAIASLCNYMAPLIVVLVAPLVLRERPEVRKLPCVAAALVGIVLVSGVLEGGGGNPGGVALGLAAAASFVCIVLCNRKLRGINAMDRSLVQLLLSAVTILPYVLVNNRGNVITVDTRSVLIVLMLGVVHTGAAYCLYFSGMSSLPVQTVAILGYLEPVVSVICSALLLNETMSPLGWLGAGLVIAAAAVSELIPGRAAEEKQ
ncbi:MAG: EamA family transporter [Clostridia bacterium]|nr:EamA family transporter [Clostridia bacterium]